MPPRVYCFVTSDSVHDIGCPVDGVFVELKERERNADSKPRGWKLLQNLRKSNTHAYQTRRDHSLGDRNSQFSVVILCSCHGPPLFKIRMVVDRALLQQCQWVLNRVLICEIAWDCVYRYRSDDYEKNGVHRRISILSCSTMMFQYTVQSIPLWRQLMRSVVRSSTSGNMYSSVEPCQPTTERIMVLVLRKWSLVPMFHDPLYPIAVSLSCCSYQQGFLAKVDIYEDLLVRCGWPKEKSKKMKRDGC